METRITLRLPPELYAAVKAEAEAALRSVNAQIEYYVRAGVDVARRRTPPGEPRGPA